MKKLFAIGLMSGTSLDGLDICYASFQKNVRWNFEILKTETIQYSLSWEEKLRNSINLTGEELMALNSEYGFLLGEVVQEFISKSNIQNLDLIASHGHTVYHQPNRRFTTQIGDGRAIKVVTQKPVVYDFRTQDVLLGGNGAPLVPIGDEHLFSEYDACINIGGFSNISFKKDNTRMAFDISPVNIILNQLVKKIGLKYDEDGRIAASNKADKHILKQLNSLNFYHKNPPKSLGAEWVIENINPILEDLETGKAISTFTQHAAEQIANTLKQYQLKKVLITGGGAYNKHLMKLIQDISEVEIILPNSEIIEFKEALIFAFMGVLRLKNENNVLCSATGSSRDHCSGILA